MSALIKKKRVRGNSFLLCQMMSLHVTVGFCDVVVVLGYFSPFFLLLS